jgi:hypothetical protein
MRPAAIADRLADYSRRLHNGSLTRASSLWAIWNSYNDAENPLRAEGVRRRRSATVLNILAQSALHETIMIVVRALDGSRGKPLASNRVSLPVMIELALLPGVRDELETRARAWMEDGWQAHENARACLAALEDLSAGVRRLEVEEPNRQRRLRNFRDEFLAHNLHFEEERERPIIGDITGLLRDLRHLSDRAELAFTGTQTEWSQFDQDLDQLSRDMWHLIRDGAEVQPR